MNYTSEWPEDLPQLLCSELDLALVSQSAVSKSGSPPEAPATTITEELLHVGFFAWASYTSSPVFHMCYDFELQPVVTGVRCSDDIASISSPVEPSMAISYTLPMSFFYRLWEYVCVCERGEEWSLTEALAKCQPSTLQMPQSLINQCLSLIRMPGTINSKVLETLITRYTGSFFVNNGNLPRKPHCTVATMWLAS